MSAGLYVLAAGATDPQRPHHEDELYYVVRGRARFRAGDEDRGVSAGTVLFVAAKIEHRFYDIKEELAVLVFFAPAET
jgi:quercetin dioxygenase-like cupin family protein